MRIFSEQAKQFSEMERKMWGNAVQPYLRLKGEMDDCVRGARLRRGDLEAPDEFPGQPDTLLRGVIFHFVQSVRGAFQHECLHG
jgi:hypothetical protein